MVIRFGQIELDEQRLMLRRDGLRLQIRPKVFDLLVHLVRYRERVVLRDELILALWGTTAVGLGSLSGLVNELRQILGESGRGPSSIRTVHARGYQFVAEIESDASGMGLRDQGSANPLGPSDTARGTIRAAASGVSMGGARAVIVVGPAEPGRSSLLDHASTDLTLAGFEIHRISLATRNEAEPSGLVDRLVDALVEDDSVEAAGSAIPLHAREFLKHVSGEGRVSKARPRDRLTSPPDDERVWRGVAELLDGLARRKPVALIIDVHDQTTSAATQVVSPLLRLLPKSPVFILCTAMGLGADGLGPTETVEPGVEYLRLPSPDRGQLNELLESRGIGPLPVALADALVAHARDDRTSLESIVVWLEAERERAGRGTDTPALPSIERRMKRVEPDTTSRRPGFGTQ